MDSSPPRLPGKSLSQGLGVKRPAPSLLPAFEESSSPFAPRPSKRQARVGLPSSEAENDFQKYPTPVPTSELGAIPSSPPQLPLSRPSLQRTQSMVSERAPLCSVPSITLLESGEPVLMGRSSNSSHYQLSANRLISRVHVKASYIPVSNTNEAAKIEVLCMGWNGVKVHCQGRMWELSKGDSFTSETDADLMLDVLSSRVTLAWPGHQERDNDRSGSTSWSNDTSPLRISDTTGSRGREINISPIRRKNRVASPESPTPASRPNFPSSSTIFLPSDAITGSTATVQVYEDEPADEVPMSEEQEVEDDSPVKQEHRSASTDSHHSKSSELSEEEDDFSDRDEENDPIIHSFGPSGDDILARMQSISNSDRLESPVAKKERLPTIAESSKPKVTQPLLGTIDTTAVRNHVINQLAFSRLSTTPLSILLTNLPTELRIGKNKTGSMGITKEQLRDVLITSACVGEVPREGKDAAGKALESEFYYLPDADDDEGRKGAVTGLRKPGLRAVRKQHKVSSELFIYLARDANVPSNTTGRSRRTHKVYLRIPTLHRSLHT
jgi:hypothetical protein